MQRLRTRLRAGGSGFNPASLFAGGGAGFWLDPSLMSTGFQESTGLTQQTATSQFTGLRLDRRLGLARGSELITSVSTQVGALTANTTVTFNGTEITCTENTAVVSNGFRTTASSGMVSGTVYEVTFTVVQASGNTLVDMGATSSINLGATTGAKRLVGLSNGATALAVYSQTGDVGSAIVIDNLSIKALAGNHFYQATSAARPLFTIEGAVYYDLHDGIDDGSATLAFSAGTLTANMDLTLAVRSFAGADMIVASEDVADATNFIGKLQATETTSGSACAGVGSAWTAWVNGVQVGGTATTTADALLTAIGSSEWKILELRNLDLSAWAKFTFGQYTSFQLDADLGGRILCPAQSDAVRTQTRNYLAQKVGLSL